MTNGINVTIEELIKLRYLALSLKTNNRKKIYTQFGNSYLSKFYGRGMDYAESRLYQNDDIRNIDWRLSGKTGKMHTKIFHEEKEIPVLFLVDFSKTMFFGSKVAFKSVIAAQVAALLAWYSINNGNRIGGVVFTEDINLKLFPKEGNNGALSLIKQLVLLSKYSPNTKKQNNFTTALKYLKNIYKSSGIIYIISDFYQLNTDNITYLQHLSHKNKITAFFIYDILEKFAPAKNYYLISDGTKNLKINTRLKQFRENYSNHFNEKYLRLKSIFQTNKINLISLSTDKPIIDILRYTL